MNLTDFIEVGSKIKKIDSNKNEVSDQLSNDHEEFSGNNKDFDFINSKTLEVLKFQTGLRFFDRKNSKNDSKSIIDFLRDEKNDSWGIFSNIRKEMEQEYCTLKIVLENFRDLPIDMMQTKPFECCQIWNSLLIRFQNICHVLSPTIHLGMSKGKYAMASVFWVNPNGETSVKYSRTFGNHDSLAGQNAEKNAESQLQALMTKILAKETNYKLTAEKSVMSKPSDFIVVKESTSGEILEEWWVNMKLYKDTKNKKGQSSGAIKTFMSLELWETYKEEYQLLNKEA
jgi:hypothetical protein